MDYLGTNLTAGGGPVRRALTHAQVMIGLGHGRHGGMAAADDDEAPGIG
jgi:hypothetical protein